MAVAFEGKTPVSGHTVSGYEHSREAPPERSTMRAFTSAQSLAEVAASAAPALWQDQVNNLVWFKVQGGQPYPNADKLPANSDEAAYKPISVVLKSKATGS
jgi:hypothetical protein